MPNKANEAEDISTETNNIFKFWYEKLMIRISFAFAFFAFIGVFVYAYFTEVMLELPGETAPFMVSQNNSQGFSETLAESQTLPLHSAHRTDRELKVWITTAVSESMFIDSADLNKVRESSARYFTAAGWKQYEDYLKSSGILDSIKNNNYRMSIFIEEQPLMMNGVVMQDVYRWLYQLPLTISFIPQDTIDLLSNRQNIVNRKMTLRVQLRRIKLPNDPDAVQIESWNMTARKN